MKKGLKVKLNIIPKHEVHYTTGLLDTLYQSHINGYTFQDSSTCLDTNQGGEWVECNSNDDHVFNEATSLAPISRLQDDHGATISTSTPPPAVSINNTSVTMIEEEHRQLNSRESFTIATYNVWFDSLHQKARAQALLDLLLLQPTCETPPSVASNDLSENTSSPSPPDVICLQEVTRTFLQVLRHHPLVQRDYWVSDVTGAQCTSRIYYGIILLVNQSRWNVRTCAEVEAPSELGRNMMMVEIESKGKGIGGGGASRGFAGGAGGGGGGNSSQKRVLRIATCHFESSKSGKRMREIQRLLAKDLLLKTFHSRYYEHQSEYNTTTTTTATTTATADNTWSQNTPAVAFPDSVSACILAGDLNLTTEEDSALTDPPLNFHDTLNDVQGIIKNHHPKSPEGGTRHVLSDDESEEDGGGRKKVPRRLDRVVYLSRDGGGSGDGEFKCRDVEYVGWKRVEGIEVFPSDHLGVVARLK